MLWLTQNTPGFLTGKTYGILDRWSVADGGNIFWKFFEPGFLKRCRGELPKSLVSPWSSRPSRGSWTVWCLERVTRIIFPYIFCPLRWLIAERDNRFLNVVLLFSSMWHIIHSPSNKKKNHTKISQCARGLIENYLCRVHEDLESQFQLLNYSTLSSFWYTCRWNKISDLVSNYDTRTFRCKHPQSTSFYIA